MRQEARTFAQSMAGETDNRKVAVARFLGNIVAYNRVPSQRVSIDRVQVLDIGLKLMVIPYGSDGKAVSSQDLISETGDALDMAGFHRRNYGSAPNDTTSSVSIAPVELEGMTYEQSEYLKGREIFVFDAEAEQARQRERLDQRRMEFGPEISFKIDKITTAGGVGARANGNYAIGVTQLGEVLYGVHLPNDNFAEGQTVYITPKTHRHPSGGSIAYRTLIRRQPQRDLAAIR